MENEENSGYFGFGIIAPCLKPMWCNAENLCPPYSSLTVWNIFMELHRWPNHIKTVCCGQGRQLWLICFFN